MANVAGEETARSGQKVMFREMRLADVQSILKIERSSFPTPWSSVDFLYHYKRGDGLAYVAEESRAVVGYAVCVREKEGLHILNFAVCSTRRREGIGTQMIEFLINVARAHNCGRIYLEVREHNLPAQIFYRRNGFRATQILKKYYSDTDEDGYLMDLDVS